MARSQREQRRVLRRDERRRVLVQDERRRVLRQDERRRVLSAPLVQAARPRVPRRGAPRQVARPRVPRRGAPRQVELQAAALREVSSCARAIEAEASACASEARASDGSDALPEERSEQPRARQQESAREWVWVALDEQPPERQDWAAAQRKPRASACGAERARTEAALLPSAALVPMARRSAASPTGARGWPRVAATQLPVEPWTRPQPNRSPTD